MTEDVQGWLDIHRQPSSLAFNPFHNLGRTHNHTPLPIIVDATMSPQIHMEDALTSPQTAKEKEKAPTPHFFNQAQWGVAPPPVPFCLGRHEHKYAKCSATKLWNRKKTFIRRNEQARLIFLNGLPICFNFQTMVGCQDTPHLSRHICSGCRVSGHGAQRCPQTQKN